MSEVARRLAVGFFRRLQEITDNHWFQPSLVLSSILLIGFFIDPLAPITGGGSPMRWELSRIEADMKWAVLFGSTGLGFGLGLHYFSTVRVSFYVDKPYPAHAKIIALMATFPPAIALQWIFGNPLYLNFWSGVLFGGFFGTMAGLAFLWDAEGQDDGAQ